LPPFSRRHIVAGHVVAVPSRRRDVSFSRLRSAVTALFELAHSF